MATNTVAGDPYLSIALPGRMYAPVYRGMKYSPLIPWNAGGAFVISALALGIADGNFENLLYIPLAFACWLSPLIGIFYAMTGLFSPKASDQEIAEWEDNGEPVAQVTA